MCLPIDSWFCCMSSTVNDDYHHPAPAPANKQQQHGPAPPPPTAPAGGRTTAQQLPAQRNGGGGGYYNVNGYPAHHQAPTATAAAEADRKTSNDVRRGSAHGHAVVPAGAQGKATDGTLKQQPATARNGMVAAAGAVDGARGVAAHNYYYYEREQPAYREDAAAAAADFYHHHHHPAATAATADHESRSEALGGE
ncbi:uncharacterized protein LOC110433391 isoform X1 [Sorghum bicolor]|uniref:uncharacterized protein LOC110433391 isoform X1 n=1 Tax=Sorghum bicolor TaxID=4558 RepID=UPI000B4257F5|nr:uncharacterized protein LOC110433391 isoform X1 [Sorghum bicolor]|eukprot:XP_021311064.1 uncharacterized protein LOC110433391 isoform X1 [Sorghum bicolor]